MARGKGYGGDFGFPRPRGGDDVSRPAATKAKGLYGNGRERGGIRVPTLVEAYERDSDYRRWRAGMDLWFGGSDSWAEVQLGWLARLKSGPVSSIIPLTTTLFPSRGSAESAWHVTARPRGAILLPTAIQAPMITLERDDPDPAKHRLIYDVRGTLSRARLAVWLNFVGDQFEDSAEDGDYPDGLIEDPVDAVALTLIEVDVSRFQLIFDLSRPCVRRTVGSRTYWKPMRYALASPLFWRADGSRHLASSPRFECSCPDYQGRSVSNLQGVRGPLSDRFPTPAAGRVPEGPWEQQAVGYAKKWRDLDPRADRRRECKHIHAVRWAAGVPFDEPTDSPLLSGRRVDTSLSRRLLPFAEIGRFYGEQLITFDRLLLGVAPLVGLNLDADGELRGQTPTFRPVNQPILWNDPVMPEYPWCRQNDWWLPRGTDQVWLFDPPSGGFVQQLGGKDVLERVPITGSSLDIPVQIGPPQQRLAWRVTTLGSLVLRLGVRKQPKGALLGSAGLGRSRLVMDTNLQLALRGTGGLGSSVLYAQPVADLLGPLSGRGRLGLGALSATQARILNGRIAGSGGLGASALDEPVRRRIETDLSGTGGLRMTLNSRPNRAFFGDWAVQRFGTEELGLIEWWGG